MVDLAQDPVAFRRSVWTAALAAATVTFAPPALGAQKVTDSSMPLPPGVIREKGLEAAAGAGEAGAQFLQIYRVGAPMELVLSWYQGHLNLREDAALDTTGLQPGDATAVSYHLTHHAFDDECRDPGASAPGSSDPAAACRKWRRGADKRRALENSRVPLPQNLWLDRITITWYARDKNGELVRRQIRVRDIGLMDNWQHDNLRSQITLERTLVGPAGQ